MENQISQKPKKKIWQKWWFWAIIAIVLIAIIGSGNPNKTNNNEPQVQNNTVAAPKTDYQIIERWEIPNGGEGKKILIPKEYLNDANMIALGERLKQDTLNDRNAFIQVYTDKRAAELRDKIVAGTATQSENELYDNNFVGQYNKNGNTGFHQFVVYFDGVMGTNQKIIKY